MPAAGPSRTGTARRCVPLGVQRLARRPDHDAGAVASEQVAGYSTGTPEELVVRSDDRPLLTAGEPVRAVPTEQPTDSAPACAAPHHDQPDEAAPHEEQPGGVRDPAVGRGAYQREAASQPEVTEREQQDRQRDRGNICVTDSRLARMSSSLTATRRTASRTSPRIRPAAKPTMPCPAGMIATM